jgi:hypothetical protein
MHFISKLFKKKIIKAYNLNKAASDESMVKNIDSYIKVIAD